MSTPAAAPRRDRPEFRNIHVTQIVRYRMPPPAMVSILHRISGAALFLALPFLLWMFDGFWTVTFLSGAACQTLTHTRMAARNSTPPSTPSSREKSMSDLVDELRRAAKVTPFPTPSCEFMSRTADEIERLRAELAALRELMNCYNLGGWTDAERLQQEREINEALGYKAT